MNLPCFFWASGTKAEEEQRFRGLGVLLQVESLELLEARAGLLFPRGCEKGLGV